MKKKFIAIGIVAVMLIAMLCAFAVPVMAPEPETGMTSESAAAETAALAVMSSEVLIIDEAAPAPAGVASGEASVWLALSALFVTIPVASKRRLDKLLKLAAMSLRGIGISTEEGAKTAGGPNKFI